MRHFRHHVLYRQKLDMKAAVVVVVVAAVAAAVRHAVDCQQKDPAHPELVSLCGTRTEHWLSG